MRPRLDWLGRIGGHGGSWDQPVALGAGLTTLVRPHLIQTVFSIERGGALNGRVARGQQFARAIGPILAASLASVLTYTAVFAVLAGTLLLAAVASRQILAESTELVKEKF